MHFLVHRAWTNEKLNEKLRICSLPKNPWRLPMGWVRTIDLGKSPILSFFHKNIGMATAPAIFRLVGQTKENRGEARVWVETIHVTINDPNFRSLYNNTKQCEMVWIVIRTRVPLLMLAHFLVFFYSASNDQKSYFNTIFHELWINDINPFINMSFSSSKWCYSFYVNSHW